MIFVGHDFDQGKDVYLPVPGEGGAHWLVGGSSGGGKTQLLHAVLCQLAAMPHTAIVISDPAWMDFAPWAPRASCIALGREGAGWLLEQLVREMEWRLREGRRLGVARLEPSAAHPKIVLIADELAMLTLGGPKGATAKLIDLAQVGRKTGIGLILATQSPKSVVIPMLCREQLACRCCLRTEEPEQTDAVLGTQRIPAHRLHRPGEGFVRHPDGRISHIRAPLVDLERIERTAAATAYLTPTLPESRGWRRLFDPYDTKETAA